MLVLAIVPLAMAAQVKIATVDVQAIFNAMPETKTAAETLENASKQYKAEYEMMQAEFNSKYEAYQAMTASKDVPQTIRDRRIRVVPLRAHGRRRQRLRRLGRRLSRRPRRDERALLRRHGAAVSRYRTETARLRHSSRRARACSTSRSTPSRLPSMTRSSKPSSKWATPAATPI